MSYHRQESSRTPQRTRSTRLVGPSAIRADQPYTIGSITRDRIEQADHTVLSNGVDESCPEQFQSSSKMTTYQPPKFRTFQERKREKERLLAIAAGKESEWMDSCSSVNRTPEYMQGGPAESTCRPLPRGPSSQNVGQESPIVLPPVGVPLDPSNILPYGNGEQASRRPLPSPASGGNHSGSTPLVGNRSTGPPAQPTMGFTATQPRLNHSATGRRLPKPSNTRPEAGEVGRKSATSPVFEQPTYSPSSPSVLNTDHGPSWTRNLQYNTDTVTSVKSLDRYGTISPDPRPLPAPPISVGPSKSLDRGTPHATPSALSSRSGPPKRPSLREVSDDDSPRPSTVILNKTGSAQSSDDRLRQQQREEGSQIINTIEVPILVLPAEDTLDESPARGEATKPRRPSAARGYSFSTIPKISVESCAAEETRDPPTISVPTFAFPDDEGAQVPSIHVDIGSGSNDEAKVVKPRKQPERHGLPKMTGPGIFCARCDGVVIGRIVTAMDRRWHPECFQCSVCHTLLEHVSSYEHDGHAYCHMDYHDQFAPKCHYCETAIVDSRFITIDDATLGQRYYHELHFFCGECGDPFLDPSKSSAAGNEFNTAMADGQEPDDLTKEFVIHGKHAFCVECDVKLHKPKCAGCRKPIRDAAVGALGAKWHSECFCCTGCDEPFPTGSFFPIDNEPFCQDCYTATLNMPRL